MRDAGSACCWLVPSSALPKASFTLPFMPRPTRPPRLTPEAVWAAIDAAKDGDTVQLPAGTAVWTKGWNTGHGAKMKAITIQGAGIDKTIIRDASSNTGGHGRSCCREWKENRSASRASPSTERDTPMRAAAGGLMTISGTCKNFRIDHCKFKNTDHMLGIDGDTYGVVDHCRFEADESHGGNVQPVDFPGPGEPNYRKPLTLGTARRCTSRTTRSTSPIRRHGGQADGQ